MIKEFIDIAKSLEPVINKETIKLNVKDVCLKEGDKYIYDFKDHYVGMVSLSFKSQGLYPDAPCLLRIKFGEREEELYEDTSSYHGWISKAWIQEEYIHLDSFPCRYSFKRRYAFRYVLIEVVSISNCYSLVPTNATLVAMTSANKEVELVGKNDLEKEIDRVALKTLKDCMQEVFEDGPKRDRRLWLGDLRLQALVNYETFKANNLVKRCLYLFAGVTDSKGLIPACLYVKPKIRIGDSYLFDYSLLYIATLYDYVINTKDYETGKKLLPIAEKQIELAKEKFEDGLVKDSNQLGWCFVDWNLYLNKQASANAIYLYSLQNLINLRKIYSLEVAHYVKEYEEMSTLVKNRFFDKEKGLFVDSDGKVSYASNSWMILSGIVSKEEAKGILVRLDNYHDALKIVTPYMYHHYIEALLFAGEKEKANKVMNEYWGAMVKLGADTFFELFNPDNPDESPYGGKAVNSYCHAWSTTPSYLLRKKF